MIESGLADQDDVLYLKFNGWRFQSFEDAKIALVEGIVTGLLETRPLLSRQGQRSQISSAGSIASRSPATVAVWRSPP